MWWWVLGGGALSAIRGLDNHRVLIHNKVASLAKREYSLKLHAAQKGPCQLPSLRFSAKARTCRETGLMKYTSGCHDNKHLETSSFRQLAMILTGHNVLSVIM